MPLKRYRKRETQAVTAVQLALDTPGFTYRKWGSSQQCQAQDWLVDNNGDCYTIAAKTFADTYTAVSPGRYLKTAPVWAEQATTAGEISTQEGSTAYENGDYLVYNQPDKTDGYAVSKDKFEAMYALD